MVSPPFSVNIIYDFYSIFKQIPFFLAKRYLQTSIVIHR
jgi:hypothetical protein